MSNKEEHLIEYVTTFVNGEEEHGYRFDVNKSEVIRYSIHEIVAYAPIVALLSNSYCKAQLLYEEGLFSTSYYVTVVLEGDAMSKYKSKDFDSKLQRVLWFFKNAHTPSSGIVVQILVNHGLKSFLDSPFSFTSLWHSKELNKGSNSDYVTLHPHGEIDWNSGRSSHRRAGMKHQIELARKKCSDLGYEVKELDYTTSIEDASNLLLNAKCHIGYIGSVHYLAAFNRTPCVTLGKHVPGVSLDPMGLHRNVQYSNLAPDYELDVGRMRVWNELGTPPGRTLMYNFNSNHMYQDEPRYYIMADPSDPIQTEKQISKALL